MSKGNNYKSKYNRSKPKPSRKPLFLILGGAVLLVVALVFAIQRPQPPVETTGGTPKLKADKQLVDLGDQKLGNAVQVSFQLTNTGDGTLHFTKDPYVEVKEGC